MANDTSDYNKPRTDLFKLLPEVLQSDVNKSVFEQVLNRFLTKEELKRSAGYVGQGNPNATINRQLPEPTPHRQAFQLQPLLYSKVGTIEHISSYKDVLGELERLGVDTNRQPLWGNALKFNWVPPVNIDKLINYFDYYWYDIDDPTSVPVYITIEDLCTVAKAKAHEFGFTILEFGSTLPIIAISTISNTITISGNVTDLFVSNFVFPITGSTNLNGTWTTVGSVFNNVTSQTVVTLVEVIPSALPVDGVVNLGLLQDALNAQVNCACTGTSGWDAFPWDSDLWDSCEETSLVSNLTKKVAQQWIVNNKWVHKTEVGNFSIAKIAKAPILEYSSTIELNAWTYVQHKWKYRKTVFDTFTDITAQPTLLELVPLSSFTHALVVASTYNITLDKLYGDLTNVFVPGFQFQTSISGGTFAVNYSTYEEVIPTQAYQTIVNITSVAWAPVLGDKLIPVNTSVGDDWRNYDEHWLYNGTYDTTATNTQVENIFVKIPETTPTVISLPFHKKLGLYAEEFYIPFGSGSQSTFTLDASLQQRSLIGTGDVRVFVNGIQQYGNYNESGANNLVNTITFITSLPETSTVLIEVAEASQPELGFAVVPVRSIENESLFMSAGNPSGYVTGDVVVSLTQYRKVEQVKNQLNQYPLFDLYNVDGSCACIASPIFTYTEDSSYPVYTPVNRRIVRSTDGKDYTFTQHLLETNTNRIYAYRDFSLREKSYWFDKDQSVVKIWDNTWSSKTNAVRSPGGTGAYLTPIVSETAPGAPWTSFNGFLWYDTLNNKLFIRNTTTAAWDELDVYEITNDATLQTIWKKGKNNEQYIPRYVDKDRQEIVVGSLLGDWEVPDQLYYNPEHENRNSVRYVELLDHFGSIIKAQPKPPGLITSSTFHSLSWSEANYGLAGTIRDHNDSYDTFLSSIFATNVTPLGLFEFGRDQYEILLDIIIEFYKEELINVLRDTTVDTIANTQTVLTNNVITQYEQNDAVGLIYGDSSTYNNGVGIRNWIATLPFLKLAFKARPSHVFDTALGINDINHHDGHRSQVSIPQNVINLLIRTLINTDDPRVVGEKLGKQSASSFPTTTTAFLTAFGTAAIRSGLYWYHVTGPIRTLYRFNVASVGNSPPSSLLPNGTLWLELDTLPLPTLRIKNGANWDPVTVVGDGIITSAWKEVNIDYMAAEVILGVEQRLYAAAPVIEELVFDFNSLTPTPAEQVVHDTYFEQAFNNYIQQSEIVAPLSNEPVYDPLDAFTWNYKQSTITLYPGSTNTGTESGGTWQDLYQKVYGTPYPHLEPWKLQGFTGKPDWWDVEYKNSTGSRKWIYTHSTTTGMWENIRIGRIPVGRFDPNNNPGTGLAGQVASTYNYFSVNISDVSVNGYAPDELFPPHVSALDGTGVQGPTVRSVFYDFNTQIIVPGADYNYGDAGLQEWLWFVSSQHLYDMLTVAFRMQPVRLIHFAFGNTYIDIQSLQVETYFEKVFSHKDTIFHGDVIGSTTYVSDGFNQWYVNHNRYYGYDMSSSAFRQLWVDWTPKLSYQFASIIDTQTLEVANKNFDTIPADYNVTLKKSPGIREVWGETFAVAAVNIPPSLVRYETQNDFKLEISTQTPISREINYYDVRNYPFHIDVGSNTCTLYKYAIVGVDIINDTFTLKGNQVEVFGPDRNLTVSGSTGNNGSWVVESSVYVPSLDTTVVTVTGNITSSTADGFVTAQYRTLPWNTGDVVYLSSTKDLPSFVDESTALYVIKLSTTTFKLALTYADATALSGIIFTAVGSGQLHVGEVVNTFLALGGTTTSNVWRHYALDKTNVKIFTSPYTYYGIQTTINLIDGYTAKLEEAGFLFNYDRLDVDPDTGRGVSWQVEIERFISWIYGIRLTRAAQPDKFPVSANITTNELTFTEQEPAFTTGTKVRMITSGVGSTLPSPLVVNQTYYVIRTATATVKLALTILDAKSGISIDLTTTGTGQFQMFAYEGDTTLFPMFELNPTRNNLWLGTSEGIVSNVLTGPFSDIRIQQLIFDQYGRPLSPENVSVYRLDKVTHLAVKNEIRNDISPQQFSNVGLVNEYDYLHLGGVHLLIDGYEHVVIFNNYSTGGALIYDPFIGISTSRFDVDFHRSITFTLRPNLGGYILRNNQLERNIESSIVDLQRVYDAIDSIEARETTQHVRALLGYDGPKDYLRQINVNSKSQFLFWKAMIQNKGSVNSVKAFINSRRFVDAKVDEFWAYKLAEFGDSREKIYPHVKLFVNDSLQEEARFEFIRDVEVPDTFFEGIKLTEDTRWHEYPDEFARLDDRFNLFFETEVTSKDETPSFTLVSGTYFYVTDVPCDDVVITKYNASMVNGVEVLVEGTHYTRINSRVVQWIVNPTLLTTPKVYTLNPAKTKLNPAKIIDVKSNVVVTEVPVWDPAKGHFYHNAYNYINLQRPTDPAKYTFTLNPNDISDASWEDIEFGNKWLDDSTISYVPYYDSKIFTDTRDQTLNWGVQSGWSSINVYEWTQSEVLPAEYTEGEARKTVFNRTRQTTLVSSVNDVSNVITVGIPLTNGDRVTITTTGTPIPTSTGTLAAGTFYYVISSVGTTFKLSETQGGTEIDITGIGTGTHTVVLAYKETDWIKDSFVRQEIQPALVWGTGPITGIIPVTFSNGTAVDIYINGKLIESSVVVTTGMVTTTALITIKDIINVVKPVHSVTTDEAAFIPAVEDTGTIHTQWKEDYEYSQRVVDVNGVLTVKYYFWVRGKTDRISGNLALIDIEQQLATIPTPYITFHKVRKEELVGSVITSVVSGVAGTGSFSISENQASKFTTGVTFNVIGSAGNDRTYTVRAPGATGSGPTVIPVVEAVLSAVVDGTISIGPTVILPNRFVQSIVHNIGRIVTEEDRYVLRYTKDFTLRHSLEDASTHMSLKNVHEEWELVRQEQLFNVSSVLWFKMVEAAAGYKIADPSIRVPTLNRELYDSIHATDTQYGLGDEQAFVNKLLVMPTVFAYLTDPNNNFSPIDINTFVATYPMNTPQSIVDGLTQIYNTFQFYHVNRIFFNVLQDAFSTKRKYADIFKTSMISLYGIRILETGGLFDD